VTVKNDKDHKAASCYQLLDAESLCLAHQADICLSW